MKVILAKGTDLCSKKAVIRWVAAFFIMRLDRFSFFVHHESKMR
jgi:hypothetical protein